MALEWSVSRCLTLADSYWVIGHWPKNAHGVDLPVNCAWPPAGEEPGWVCARCWSQKPCMIRVELGSWSRLIHHQPGSPVSGDASLRVSPRTRSRAEQGNWKSWRAVLGRYITCIFRQWWEYKSHKALVPLADSFSDWPESRMHGRRKIIW